MKNVFCEAHLYTLANRKSPFEVEERLAKLEGLLAPYLHRVDDARAILSHERKVIAGLFAIQYMRTPRMLKWWEELQSLLVACHSLATELIPPAQRSVALPAAFRKLRELLGVPRDSPQPDFADWGRWQDITQEQIRDLATHEILQKGKRLRDIIACRTWSFLLSPERKFVTADEPVRVSDENGGNASLEAEDSIAFWPLTPRCVLVVGSRALQDGEWYTVSGGEGCVNHWISTRATMLVTHRNPEDVLKEIQTHKDCGIPVLYSASA